MNINKLERELFAVEVLALLAFTPNWDADLFDQINDHAVKRNQYIEDTQDIRTLCQNYELDSCDYGDTAPTLTFEHPRHTDETAITQAFNDWHDAKVSENPVKETNASEALIETLARAAGIRIK